jgi:CheY-like chemotaxis protein
MIFEDKLKTVLVIDDEPFQTEWLTDYFQSRDFEVVQAEDLQSALAALEAVRYRYVIIDLSIPFSPALAQPLAALGSEFFRYPGLMAARRARTTGHNTFQVIVYSVHDSADVESYAGIVCKYILKGRPRELKSHIENTMHRTPHGWRSTKPKPKQKQEPKQKSSKQAKVPVRKKKQVPKTRFKEKRKSFYTRYPAFLTKKKRDTKGGDE